MAEVVEKYLVKFTYVLDEDTTFRYESDCKKLLQILQPVGLICGGKADQILIQIEQLFNSFKERNSLTSVFLKKSFNVEIWKLNGINLVINAVVLKDYIPDDSALIYSGSLDNYGKG